MSTSTLPQPDTVAGAERLNGDDTKSPLQRGEVPLGGEKSDEIDDLKRAKISRDLRMLIIEVRALRAILSDLSVGKVSIRQVAPCIKKSHGSIGDLIGSVDRYADNYTQEIYLTWDLIKEYPVLCSPDQVEADPQPLLQAVSFVNTQLERIIFLSGHWTVPQHISEWLAEAIPGSVLPFRVIFEEELVNRDYQQSILNHIICTPIIDKNLRQGVIDTSEELVYRSSKSHWRSAGKLLLLLVILLIETAVIYAAGMLNVLEVKYEEQGRVFTDWGKVTNLLVGWGAVLLGATVYGVVQSLRRSADEIGISVLPFRRTWLMIGARIQMLILSSLALLIGYVALVYTFGIPEAGNSIGKSFFLFSAFLTGYGIDSIANTVGSSLDERMAEQQANMRKRLEGS